MVITSPIMTQTYSLVLQIIPLGEGYNFLCRSISNFARVKNAGHYCDFVGHRHVTLLAVTPAVLEIGGINHIWKETTHQGDQESGLKYGCFNAGFVLIGQNGQTLATGGHCNSHNFTNNDPNVFTSATRSPPG